MYCYTWKTVRLACLNHAASVHSEPGSNSPKRVQKPSDSWTTILGLNLSWDHLNFLIGGPNQSHKVNFKELPTKGKEKNQILFQSVRQPFSGIFEFKSEIKNTVFNWSSTFERPGPGTCNHHLSHQVFNSEISYRALIAVNDNCYEHSCLKAAQTSKENRRLRQF